MKILLTGGTSFIGSHVALELVKHGHGARGEGNLRIFKGARTGQAHRKFGFHAPWPEG